MEPTISETGDDSMFKLQRYLLAILYFPIILFFTTTALMGSSILISWDANTESDLSGYQIRYGLSSADMPNSVNTGKNTEYEFKNLLPGQTYYFVVFAIDYSGNVSNPSEVVSAKMPDNPGNGIDPNIIYNKISGQNLRLRAIYFGLKHGLGSIRDSLYYFWDNGSISWNIHFDSTRTYYFEFLAKSNEYINNEWSSFEVQLDSMSLDVVSVDSSDFKFFSREFQVEEGMHVLKISFLNDIFNPAAGWDRNLIFDYVQISEFNKDRPDTTGSPPDSVGPVDEILEIEKVFKLNQNYPNPFNPSTTISFDLGAESYIQLTIFNIVGQKVKTLFAGELNNGSHNFTWNARNEFGQPLASGVYYYLLEALSVENYEGALALKTAQRETKRMIYMR
ncbi:MAG: T9SS C-terminal target domain-containing protein [Calditrichaeota bacterium]|nr:MAG: T9SS C-terminal target domain-containing protein [Calditrichota bacterium]